MTQYLVSFDDGAMTFPEEEGPPVADAADGVVQAAQGAGVWIFGGAVENKRVSIMATDGMVTDGPYPETKAVIGGVRDRRRALARGDTAAGSQVRRRLPLRAGGPGDHVRPARLIEGDSPRPGQ